MRLRATRLTAIASAAKRFIATFSPSSLFANNEQGVWYDPSDMSTMFQDSAGTTPVTAVEQPVGRILDKSGRGNHATQTTTTSRPVLSARVNLLTATEDFSPVAGWSPVGCTIISTTQPAPNGTLTATKVSLTSDARATRAVSGSANVASIYTIRLRGAAGTKTAIRALTGAGGDINKVITLTGDWQTEFLESASGFTSIYYVDVRQVGGTPRATEIEVWGADVRATNMGVGLPAYQRVNTSTDYDTTGFPHYLRFDGVDDWLVTPSIDFTSTDKMTVFAGVRKNTLNAAALAEFGSNVNTDDGSFGIFAAGNAISTDYAISARGNITQAAIALGFQPPITNIVAGTFDLSGDSLVLRVNKIQVAQNTSDLGTGNFGVYQLNIGRRQNNTARFNGNLYSLIVRGAQSTAQQVTQTEQWVNGKTRVY